MFAEHNTHYEKLILIYATEHNNSTVHVVTKQHMDVLKYHTHKNILLTN
jgi:hypothetical protein